MLIDLKNCTVQEPTTLKQAANALFEVAGLLALFLSIGFILAVLESGATWL